MNEYFRVTLKPTDECAVSTKGPGSGNVLETFTVEQLKGLTAFRRQKEAGA